MVTGALSPLEACLIALSGLVIVFIVLAVLCGMIPVVSKVVSAIESRKAKPLPPVPAAEAKPAENKPAAPQTYTGEVALIGCDEKTAAMVMAIVSHETGIPLNELIFRKIKAL